MSDCRRVIIFVVQQLVRELILLLVYVKDILCANGSDISLFASGVILIEKNK